MAKAVTIKVKMVSKRRHRLLLRHQEEPAHQDREARQLKKYDPVARKHVVFKES